MWLILIITLIFFLIIILYSLYYLDCYRYFFLDGQNLKSLEKEYKYKKLLKNTIISFTTTPDRISKIKYVLMSILDQSCAVEEIRINVPYKSCKGVEYKIPKWLEKMKCVKIYRTEKDWGPATKLIPTLLDKNNRDKKIIVVDDDVIYGYYTIENLYNYFQKYNHKNKKTAVTMYGDDHDTDNAFFTRFYNYVTGENYVDLLRGHSAYMVTPNMFSKNLYKYQKFPKECFYVDDNYFSAHLKKNGVKILMVGMTYKSVPLPEMNACQIGALHAGANHNGKNEKIVNKYFWKRMK